MTTTLTSSLRSVARRFQMGTLALLTVASLVPAQGPTLRGPNLPAGCEALRPPAGNRVSFHVFAVGVQVYQWNATTNAWVFQEPVALLFADAGCLLPVGVHFVGPTWMSLSGSQVVAGMPVACTPDPTAIPWLRLTAVSTAGQGVFAGTTFIQRTNTTGGRAPTRAGTANEKVYVPYTAEYWFYRAS